MSKTLTSKEHDALAEALREGFQDLPDGDSVVNERPSRHVITLAPAGKVDLTCRRDHMITAVGEADLGQNGCTKETAAPTT